MARSGTAPPGADDEFSEADTVAAAVEAEEPIKFKDTRKAATQSNLAYVIVSAVLVLYFAALLGLIFGALDIDSFKEAALALGAPLGLATAVAAFFYGSEKE